MRPTNVRVLCPEQFQVEIHRKLTAGSLNIKRVDQDSPRDDEYHIDEREGCERHGDSPCVPSLARVDRSKTGRGRETSENRYRRFRQEPPP